MEFTPDGVLAVTHAGLGKTLLFFLEVDMATETLASPRRSEQDVRQKIINYQTYFHLQRYKHYESFWDCQLRGFRLLFLVHGQRRMVALCGLARRMPPSDFIWLTDRQSLLTQGVWGPIWVQGGQADRQRQSILGSKMPQPSPDPSAVP